MGVEYRLLAGQRVPSASKRRDSDLRTVASLNLGKGLSKELFAFIEASRNPPAQEACSWLEGLKARVRDSCGYSHQLRPAHWLVDRLQKDLKTPKPVLRAALAICKLPDVTHVVLIAT